MRFEKRYLKKIKAIWLVELRPHITAFPHCLWLRPYIDNLALVYNCGIHKNYNGNNIHHNFHNSEHLVCNFTSTNSTLLKLKPMKFKQNGVRAQSPKEKERNLGFCFSFFESQVYINAGTRTHTCVIWLKYRFSCLMTLD